LPHPLWHAFALSPGLPFLVSTGPNLWHRSSPVTAWYLAIFNKSDAVQTSPFLLNRTKTIKSLTAWPIPTLQHVSSNMQTPPHDTSRGYSYQRHHQPSLSSTHSPNYMDHAAQPVGYHPVVQNAQVQRSTYGHPQDHHHPGMLLPLSQLISTHVDVNSIGHQQPRRSAKPPYRPAIRVIRESSIFSSAIYIRRSACESVIEPGCAWPLPKLPSHRTRATYCPITTSSTLL